MVMISRRSMLGFLAAPAIVRAASLMPVKVMLDLSEPIYGMGANECLMRFEELMAKRGHYERMWQEVAYSIINRPAVALPNGKLRLIPAHPSAFRVLNDLAERIEAVG